MIRHIRLLALTSVRLNKMLIAYSFFADSEALVGTVKDTGRFQNSERSILQHRSADTVGAATVNQRLANQSRYNYWPLLSNHASTCIIN